MFIYSHVHNPAPHGSRVRVVNRPRDRVPFTTLFKSTGPGSAVAVSGLQVRQVEDLQLEVLEVMVAVRLLDQPADLVVESLDRGVRRAAELPEAEDARKVFLYRGRHGDEVVDLRRLRLADPVREEPCGVDLRLRVGVDRAELLLEEVRRVDVRVLGEHPVQPGLRLRVFGDVLGVHQEQLHVSLEILLRPVLVHLGVGHDALDRLAVPVGCGEVRETLARVGVDLRHRHPADVVDVLVHLHDDVEVVEHDQRVLAQVVPDPGVVGIRHVHANAPDPVDHLLLPEPVGKLLQRGPALAPRHVQDAPGVEVPHDCDVLAALPLVAEDVQLVDPDPRHSLEVNGLVLSRQDALLGVLDRPPVDAELLRDGRDRCVRPLRDDEPLERP